MYTGDTTGFDVGDCLAAFGSPLDALMYANLSLPSFIDQRQLAHRMQRAS